MGQLLTDFRKLDYAQRARVHEPVPRDLFPALQPTDSSSPPSYIVPNDRPTTALSRRANQTRVARPVSLELN